MIYLWIYLTGAVVVYLVSVASAYGDPGDWPDLAFGACMMMLMWPVLLLLALICAPHWIAAKLGKRARQRQGRP